MIDEKANPLHIRKFCSSFNNKIKTVEKLPVFNIAKPIVIRIFQAVHTFNEKYVYFFLLLFFFVCNYKLK